MKTYQNESEFVTLFSKDAKESLKSNGKFEAEFNGVAIVVTSMDNNNASKVTMYTGTIDGVSFKGNITQLKKRLNITFTKEYNRTCEAAKSANTKVVIKSDSELEETAKVAADRIKQAVATLNKYANRFAIMFDVLVADGYEEEDESGNPTWVHARDMILAQLKQERDEAKRALAEREAKEREAKEQAAKEQAAKEAQKAELLARIADASAKGKMQAVIDLSKELAKLTK